ncbi:MAG: ThuA domain-containing protein [Verrucomicrobia bacterium]|nr:ThuA domain-containing protein [Verrucomicrobiota bacterium]
MRALSLALLVSLAFAAPVAAAGKKVLLIAGTISHGPGAHEHNAGVLLLQKCLKSVPDLQVEVSLNGWPKDPAALNGIDAVVMYCDGGVKHLALADNRLAVLGALARRGVGIGCVHYAVEPTKEKGQAEFLQWMGGAFEIDWSVNPHWDAHFKSLPTHPITRGVKPFTIRDEWYFNMRFVEGRKGVTPILVAVPDASTTSRPDGHHSGNPTVRAAVARGEAQVVSWAYERPDGGRGFGCTGAHFHANWGNDDFRRTVLNAILWLAKVEVPAGGVVSTVTAADLAANLDPKPAVKAKAAKKAEGKK